MLKKAAAAAALTLSLTLGLLACGGSGKAAETPSKASGSKHYQTGYKAMEKTLKDHPHWEGLKYPMEFFEGAAEESGGKLSGEALKAAEEHIKGQCDALRDAGKTDESCPA